MDCRISRTVRYTYKIVRECMKLSLEIHASENLQNIENSFAIKLHKFVGIRFNPHICKVTFYVFPT